MAVHYFYEHSDYRQHQMVSHVIHGVYLCPWCYETVISREVTVREYVNLYEEHMQSCGKCLGWMLSKGGVFCRG